MQPIVRDIVFQPFETLAVAVGITPTPISPNFTKADLIDSFAVSVPSTAANNVFIGNTAVTTTTGLEIVAGAGPLQFIIRNQNIQYDIHSSLDPLADAMLPCNVVQVRGIPFVVWDLTQICLVATAPTTVVVAPFRAVFI